VGRKAENVKDAVQSRRRRDTVGEKVDQGLDTVRGAGESAKEKVNQAGEDLKRKGENVKEAVQSRRRRDTVGENVDQGVDKLKQTGEDLKRKGENVGDAIKSRLRRAAEAVGAVF